MKKITDLIYAYRILIVALLAVIIYLQIKAIFWPMQKTITALVQQHQGDISNLDTTPQIVKQHRLLFDEVKFRHDFLLYHENTGYLDFRANFFITIITELKVLKESDYLFTVTSDDGFRLRLNNTVVCEYLDGRSYEKSECRYKLRKGRYLLQLDYFQGLGKLGLKLTYGKQIGNQYYVGEDSDLMEFRLADMSKVMKFDSQPNRIEKITIRAEAGDSHAQVLLAEWYFEGERVKQDLPKAFKWFRSAAISGDDFAQFYLGKMLHKGIGVPMDINEALYWLRLSANNFNFDAQYYLGKMLYDGDGVEQNARQAFYWIKKAAIGAGEDNQHPFFVSKESGNKNAQQLLAKMYELGTGVEQNLDLAEKWRLKSSLTEKQQ